MLGVNVSAAEITAAMVNANRSFAGCCLLRTLLQDVLLATQGRANGHDREGHTRHGS